MRADRPLDADSAGPVALVATIVADDQQLVAWLELRTDTAQCGVERPSPDGGNDYGERRLHFERRTVLSHGAYDTRRKCDVLRPRSPS